MLLVLEINPEIATEEEIKTFRSRRAARAVVFDEAGKIGLMHSLRDELYKLPGGGIDQGESSEDAVIRECLEELGTKIEITGVLGTVIEYRKSQKLRQESDYYFARTVGAKGEPRFTPIELEAGFEVLWVPIEEALKLVELNMDTKDPFKYMPTRELAMLRLALEAKVQLMSK